MVYVVRPSNRLAKTTTTCPLKRRRFRPPQLPGYALAEPLPVVRAGGREVVEQKVLERVSPARHHRRARVQQREHCLEAQSAYERRKNDQTSDVVKGIRASQWPSGER